jgi:hypothetical protein
LVGVKSFVFFCEILEFIRAGNAFFNNFCLQSHFILRNWRYRIIGVSKKVSKFHLDMFTSLENQIPSTLSICNVGGIERYLISQARQSFQHRPIFMLKASLLRNISPGT